MDCLVRRLRADDSVVAVVVFGSYARGDFGRKSDLDLLILLRRSASREEASEAQRRVARVVGEVEGEKRLPIHLASLVAEAGDPDALGQDLLHELWTDGVVLYAEAAALAMLRPGGLAPWSVVRFSVKNAAPRDRVRLARRLHGQRGRPGIVRRPGLDLARGVTGAAYTIIPVWREV